jgi:hypothetical protein
MKGMAEWFKAADCKSVDVNIIVGSNPALFKKNYFFNPKHSVVW